MFRILVASVLLLAVVPLAPAASACDVTKSCSVSKYGYCIEGTAPCSGGMLACATIAGNAVACAPDPCADANCWNAESTGTAVCVHDFCPDWNPGVCVVGQKPCYQADLACVTNDGQATLCVPNPCGIPVRCFALP